jgi:polyhydroxybutyrate depolymerase
MREATAHRFDQLADEQGLIVVYPDGYERHWNDCRKIAHYSARTRNIDDLGFLRALVEHLRVTYGADARRVYVVGYSNGGQMAFRLALEAPDLLAGIAAVAANLPAPENMDCQASGRPVPVLLLNGTADPINPYEGGEVTIFGHGNRGRVLSSADSAAWIAKLDGAEPEVVAQRLPSSQPADKGWAERSVWKAPSGMEVGLYTIHGGGHTLPQPQAHYPPQLGNTYTGIDGPLEIWRFFARQPPRPTSAKE